MTDEVKAPVVSEEVPYASWDDLADPGPPIEVDVLVGGKKVRVKYRSFVAADRLADIQARGRGKSKQVITDILKEVMIEPPIQTTADARKAMKANGRVIMGIVGEVMDTQAFRELKEDLGEDL
jgi:hypothetical protein